MRYLRPTSSREALPLFQVRYTLGNGDSECRRRSETAWIRKSDSLQPVGMKSWQDAGPTGSSFETFIRSLTCAASRRRFQCSHRITP
jgi:hypothetical protein